MICTSRLSEITERPEVRQFTASVLDYMTSDTFADTVARDTPANRAISLIFIRCPATFLSHALFILCHVIRS